MNNVSSFLAGLNNDVDSSNSVLDLINNGSSAKNADAPKSLLDLIDSHNSSEVVDAPKSLSDLINSHSSVHLRPQDDGIKLLTDCTSKFFNEKGKLSTEESASALPSALSNLTILGQNPKNETDDCNTLEAYTKSFLNSKGCNILQFRKSRPPPNSLSQPLSKILNDDPNIKLISEKLKNVQVDVPRKADLRKIDLTSALQSRSEVNRTSLTAEIPAKTKPCVFTYPARECNFDLSSLADVKLLYGSTSLSPLGYVLSKPWNRITLPKKYRRLERIRPYNITKSFKFDTPSPDLITTRCRVRSTSTSDPEEQRIIDALDRNNVR